MVVGKRRNEERGHDGPLTEKITPPIFAMDKGNASYYGVEKNVAKAFSVGKEVKKKSGE